MTKPYDPDDFKTFSQWIRQRHRLVGVCAAACGIVILLTGAALFLHYPSPNRMRVGANEVRASANLDRASGNPLKLRAFLEQMPRAATCTCISAARSMPRHSCRMRSRTTSASTRSASAS